MIEVHGLTKFYGSIPAISDLTFTIPKGEITGFLGLNGAGKSTALKILAGFLLPTAGTVEIEGIDLLAQPEAMRARIGFLPERPPLYGEMTVEGFLSWLGRLRGMGGSQVAARLPMVLERTGLKDRRAQVIDTLSLGYRKRLGIAQAVIHDPALVILDEPTDGLDPVQRVQMRELVRGLRGEHTVLISSHNLPEVQETCEQILVLHGGRLVAQGTVADILGRVGGAGGSRVVVHLTLRGDGPAAVAFIGGLGLGASARLPRPGLEGLSALEVEVASEHVERLAAALVGEGFGLRHLSVADNELEAAFLAVTASQGAPS